MELFLIVWLLCGGIAAAVAHMKGRNVGAWLLVGMLWGPIGLIVLACLKAQPAGARGKG